MPDIVIAGATFRGVPQIDIPKEGSGTASFIYEDGTKQITQNGTGIDVSGYAAVDVAVPSTAPVIQSLSVTQNGEYIAPSGVDGYSPVTVNVPGIVPSGSQTVTENGTYDVTSLAEMVVNVSGGGGASNVVTGTFTVGATGGAIENITIPYTGNGYPIAAMIYVEGGAYNSTSTGQSDWYNSKTQYAIGQWTMSKSNQALTPTYGTSGSANTAVITVIYKNSTTSATSYSRASVMNFICFTSNNPGMATNTQIVTFKDKKSLYYTTTNGTSNTYGLLPNITYRYWVIYSE